MSDTLTIPNPQELASWGDRRLNNAIRRGHAIAGSHMAAYEEAATMTGVLLLERKRRLGHGQWLPWLEKHFDGDRRTAQRYMKRAEANASSVSHLDAPDEPSEQAAPEPDTGFDPSEWDDEELDPEPEERAPRDESFPWDEPSEIADPRAAYIGVLSLLNDCGRTVGVLRDYPDARELVVQAQKLIRKAAMDLHVTQNGAHA
jgi:hypothetical protein